MHLAGDIGQLDDDDLAFVTEAGVGRHQLLLGSLLPLSRVLGVILTTFVWRACFLVSGYLIYELSLQLRQTFDLQYAVNAAERGIAEHRLGLNSGYIKELVD